MGIQRTVEGPLAKVRRGVKSSIADQALDRRAKGQCFLYSTTRSTRAKLVRAVYGLERRGGWWWGGGIGRCSYLGRLGKPLRKTGAEGRTREKCWGLAWVNGGTRGATDSRVGQNLACDAGCGGGGIWGEIGGRDGMADCNGSAGRGKKGRTPPQSHRRQAEGEGRMLPKTRRRVPGETLLRGRHLKRQKRKRKKGFQ